MEETKMKIKKDYVLKEIAGQFVVVPVGEEAIKFNGIISLNKSGKRLFSQLQTEQTEDDLVKYLLSVYDVTEEQAKEDVKKFLKILKENNLLDEQS